MSIAKTKNRGQDNFPYLIKLPLPQLKGQISLEESIAKRRSIIRFKAEPLSIYQLGQILWAAQGITSPEKSLRAAPSAGGTYPLEIFLIIGKQAIAISSGPEVKRYAGVAELPAGIYYYHANTHALQLHRSGDLRTELAGASLDQGFLATVPVDIVICAVYSRTLYTYGERGKRYIHMETGHAGENIHLQVTTLGLATVEVGAFDDVKVRNILKVDSQFKPLYIMPVGIPL
ncbi:MAG: SagB/ThcOx family dehydrogenase [Dehalococcoidia bacterium]|nr:SagB/ThcOx family dehydrogenase [Dehalococcoidia bacterium]